jgi:hypothetical protein
VPIKKVLSFSATERASLTVFSTTGEKTRDKKEENGFGMGFKLRLNWRRNDLRSFLQDRE